MRRLLPLVLLALAAPAHAQSYAQDARAAALVPSMLGRGDAGVALARRETAFFVNPAHVAATSGGFHFTLAGAALSGTPSALDVGQRLREEANGGGYEEPCDTDGDGVPDDYCTVGGGSAGNTSDEIVRLARSPAELRATVLLPSFSIRSGRVGASAGAFAHSTLRVQSVETPAGDSVFTFLQTDGIGALTLSAQLPEALAEATGPITVGLGVRYIRRFVSTYRLSPDELEALDDPALVEAAAVAVDLGALWTTPVQGLNAGLAVYDLGGAMDYVPSDFFGLLGTGGSTAEARRIEREVEGREAPSLRLGVAYRPSLPAGLPLGLTVLADYASAASTGYGQSALAHLRLGAEASLGGVLTARAGLGNGGPAVGLGLNLVVLKLDYALYSRPLGEVPGQDGGLSHGLLLRLGLD